MCSVVRKLTKHFLKLTFPSILEMKISTQCWLTWPWVCFCFIYIFCSSFICEHFMIWLGPTKCLDSLFQSRFPTSHWNQWKLKLEIQQCCEAGSQCYWFLLWKACRLVLEKLFLVKPVLGSFSQTKGRFLLSSFPLILPKAMHANNRYLGTSHSLGGLKWQSPTLTALAGTKLVSLVAGLPQKEEVWFCFFPVEMQNRKKIVQ